jgi:Family of unknown function (DUF6428)
MLPDRTFRRGEIMTVETLLTTLNQNPGQPLHLMLPSGEFVPAHFHVTEVGRVQKDFIDCGGTTRSTTSCLLQVWVASDTDHRLDTTKLAKIIDLSKSILLSMALPVEVEYEGEVVSQYPLGSIEVTPGGLLLRLGTKHTACLAVDKCGAGECSTMTCC